MFTTRIAAGTAPHALPFHTVAVPLLLRWAARWAIRIAAFFLGVLALAAIDILVSLAT